MRKKKRKKSRLTWMIFHPDLTLMSWLSLSTQTATNDALWSGVFFAFSIKAALSSEVKRATWKPHPPLSVYCQESEPATSSLGICSGVRWPRLHFNATLRIVDLDFFILGRNSSSRYRCTKRTTKSFSISNLEAGSAPCGMFVCFFSPIFNVGRAAIKA